MEDLRDVGQNSLDAINKLGASDVGDLVLGIGDLIEELYDTPEDKREGKLEHLRGLFREFAHGEEYEYRDERLEPQQPEDPSSMTGMLPNHSPFGATQFPSPLSGTIASGAVSGSYSLSNTPPSILPPPLPKPSFFDDDADYDEKEEEIEVEAEPKEFVKHWWNSQEQEEAPEEQLDD